MKNIKLRMVGGLGNQLFQFTYALILRKSLNYDKIIIDISDMSKYKENWGFLLYDILDKNKLEGIIIFNKSYILKSRMIKVISSLEILSSSFGFISDKNSKYFLKRVKLKSKKTLYLDGYFELYDKIDLYVNTLKPYLRDDLFISIPENILVINIRGGEFINIGRSSIEDKEAYEKIISIALSKISNPKIHVVSDDVNFAKILLQDICKVEMYLPQNPFDNFRYLYSAKHKIIARSTFSKWAGYLSSDFSNIYYLEDIYGK